MLLLDNGYVYACGNNFYAQLGYNFRQKNYKENQVRVCVCVCVCELNIQLKKKAVYTIQDYLLNATGLIKLPTGVNR